MSGQMDDASMSTPQATATPLFIDTGAFYARMDQDDAHHGRATAVFDAIQNGTLPYRPLYTTGYVLAELVTLGLVRANHALAATALRRVRASSSVTGTPPGRAEFRGRL